MLITETSPPSPMGDEKESKMSQIQFSPPLDKQESTLELWVQSNEISSAKLRAPMPQSILHASHTLGCGEMIPSLGTE